MSITEEEQYLAMVRRYGGIITKICYYYAKDKEDFKDLRQDVLAVLWQSRDAFREEASESTWIYRLTLNTCISTFRKRKRSPESSPLDSIAEVADNGADIEAEERYRHLHYLISQLNAREKALILMWLDEMSYDQIAAVTGAPRNTVATQLRRVKEKLIKMSNL